VKNQAFNIVYLCGVFNMLLDKPFANSQVSAITEYFLFKTARAGQNFYFECD